MNQIVKPDRPIWPPVPETTVPPQPPAPCSEPRAAPAEPKDRDAALHEALLAESDRKAGLSAFEGFGSFSG
jgi:hypothetical protein